MKLSRKLIQDIESGKYSTLIKHQRTIFFVFVFFLLFLNYFFLIRPSSTRFLSQNKAFAEQKNILLAQQQKINSAPVLIKEIEELTKRINNSAFGLVSKQKLSNFAAEEISGLVKASGLTIISLSLASSEAKTISVGVEAYGSFTEFLAFIKLVEDNRKIMTLEGLSLTRKDETDSVIKGKILLAIYFWG